MKKSNQTSPKIMIAKNSIYIILIWFEHVSYSTDYFFANFDGFTGLFI